MSNVAAPVPRVPRMQVITARNQKMAAEIEVQQSTIRGLRAQLRGLNERSTKLAAENEVLCFRIRRQLRMLDKYREQGFRRSAFTPLHVLVKQAVEGVKDAAATAALFDGLDDVDIGPGDEDVGAIEGSE